MAGLEELRWIVGDAHARAAGEGDAIDGVAPRFVVAPAAIEEVSRVLSLSRDRGWAVAPRGSGTGLGLGNSPRRLDLVLETVRLNRIIEHAAGDLVVSVESGVRLSDLQAQVAGAGQMLAIDPPSDQATIGGLIATNATGPRRLRYGTIRDLLIGVTLVLADGQVAKAGGKVVKNVAGYDLSKLMTGSLGTLGVVVGAIFRLHPMPRFRRVLEVDLPNSGAIDDILHTVRHSSLIPSAIQLQWRSGWPPRLALLIEGVEPSVIAQAAAAAELLTPAGSPATYDDPDGSRWRTLLPVPVAEGATQIRITCLPSRVGETAGVLKELADSRGGEWEISGILGNGVLDLYLEDARPAAAEWVISELRRRIQPGTVVLVSGSVELKQRVEVWGTPGNSLVLMKRVKEQFDPAAILNPGRFVGGI